MGHVPPERPYDGRVSALPPRPDTGLPPPPPPPFVHAPTQRRRASRRGFTTAAATLILIALVAAALVPSVPRLSRTSTTTSGTNAPYSFILSRPTGDPVRWNPCDPIHYVVNLGTAPDSSLDDVHEAVRRVSAATGITFVDDGFTQEIPMDDRDAYQPATYGDRWAPVLIAWVTPSQTDIPFSKNGHTAAGVASPQVPDAGQLIYVSGWVAINAADPNAPGFGYYGDEGLVLQHELTHVVGLGHVKEWGELMEGSGGGVTDYGPGDLAGLDLVGRDQGCLATPEPG